MLAKNGTVGIMEDRKIAVLDVLIFFAIIALGMMIISYCVESEFAPWLTKGFMIIFTVLVILVKHRTRDYGFVPKNLKLSLKWSLIFMFTIIMPAIMIALIAGLHIDILKALLSFVWFIIFTGIAEESAFRGYIQSRLNESFTEKYNEFLGFEVTWHKGTVIAAVIFGLAHLLNGINIKTGRISITVALLFLVVLAILIGILFGVMREISGDIYVCSVVHGSINFAAAIIGMDMLAFLSLTISFAILFGLLFSRFISDFENSDK